MEDFIMSFFIAMMFELILYSPHYIVELAFNERPFIFYLELELLILKKF